MSVLSMPIRYTCRIFMLLLFLSFADQQWGQLLRVVAYDSDRASARLRTAGPLVDSRTTSARNGARFFLAFDVTKSSHKFRHDSSTRCAQSINL